MPLGSGPAVPCRSKKACDGSCAQTVVMLSATTRLRRSNQQLNRVVNFIDVDLRTFHGFVYLWNVVLGENLETTLEGAFVSWHFPQERFDTSWYRISTLKNLVEHFAVLRSRAGTYYFLVADHQRRQRLKPALDRLLLHFFDRLIILRRKAQLQGSRI